MGRKNWTDKQKLQIVLEGLKGNRGIGELCNDYEISQSQYYQWRDRLLNASESIFSGNADKQRNRHEKKVNKLNQVIGELTVALKKTEELL